MRRLLSVFAVAAAIALVATAVPFLSAQAGDEDRVVPGGGIFAPGWQGKVIDSSSIQQGRTITDSKFSLEGNALKLAIGPAGIYWNPAHTASGDYTVSGTFTEPTFQTVNTHPHPYGIFIGGNKLGTDGATLLYCAPYGNGTFIVRGFGPAPFQMGGRRPTAHDAVNKAAGVGQPVTQQIAWTVKGGRAECSINGQVVAGYDKAELVGAGKLESLDGIFGIRVSHNLDIVVTNFGKK
jgi:hypothetical protein